MIIIMGPAIDMTIAGMAGTLLMEIMMTAGTGELNNMIVTAGKTEVTG
jgi:hypothetical protein